MFDLIAGREKHLPSRAGLPVVLTAIAQVCVIGAVAATSIMFATDTVPEVTDVLAFVVETPPPPLPPPPPPAPAATRSKSSTSPKPAVAVERSAPIPVEEPPIVQQPLDDEAADFDVPGGVQGGVPGGVVGGVVGGLPEAPPPPPPTAPVRVGGQIKTPALLRRVEPYYPPVAVAARLQGTVILEAVVGRDGAVTGLKVLRSSGTPVLDREAELAVRQWQYEPLLLNGRREPFVLTVTLSFNLDSKS